MPAGSYGRSRWVAAAFLGVALGMVLIGQTVLRDRLGPHAFLIFWSVCMMFTLLAIFAAFWDVILVRRRTRQEQRALIDDALRQIASRAAAAEKREKTGDRG